jgi:zinc finger CCCH domain-containing protein 13
MSMRKVSIKLRMTLNRLRKVQRDRQLEIEARLKNVEDIPSKYCQICKLYFRQQKSEHRASEDHVKIRNFLKPHCKVSTSTRLISNSCCLTTKLFQICKVQLLSAMKYEVHKCSILHLKQKARKHEDNDEFDLQELNLDDFRTVDSVGECEIDGEEGFYQL